MPQKIPYFKHSFHHTKLRNYTGNYKIWIFRSVPNSVMSVSENSFYSYDSNGVIRNFISALGDKKRELPVSLFTCSFSASPRRIRMYNMSLERYSWRESNAVRIVGNASVGTKLFEEQVWQIGTMGGGMRSRDRNRLTGGPGGDVRLHTTLPGTLEKGGTGFHIGIF